MDNATKEFIKELLDFIHQTCPSYLVQRMFQLEEKAKKLGVY